MAQKLSTHLKIVQQLRQIQAAQRVEQRRWRVVLLSVFMLLRVHDGNTAFALHRGSTVAADNSGVGRGNKVIGTGTGSVGWWRRCWNDFAVIAAVVVIGVHLFGLFFHFQFVQTGFHHLDVRFHRLQVRFDAHQVQLLLVHLFQVDFLAGVSIFFVLLLLLFLLPRMLVLIIAAVRWLLVIEQFLRAVSW